MFCIHINKYVYFKFKFLLFSVYKFILYTLCIKMKSKSGFLFGYDFVECDFFFTQILFRFFFWLLLKHLTEIESFSCEQYRNLKIYFFPSKIWSVYSYQCAMSKWNCIKGKVKRVHWLLENIFFLSCVIVIVDYDFAFWLLCHHEIRIKIYQKKRMFFLAVLWDF